jgi:probable phosphoglycerate mutase
LTTFLLIRHGLTDAVGHRITGRLPGVHLNDTGRSQAARLPDRVARWKIDAIYSSPLERARETAAPVAEKLGLPVRPEISFAEFDFGEWSGMLISELDQREDWKRFCHFRSGLRAPGGEMLPEVAIRFVSALQTLLTQHPDQIVAVFSHADAIKAGLMHYLSIPFDHIHRLDIQPASISVLRLRDWGPQVQAVNLSEQ